MGKEKIKLPTTPIGWAIRLSSIIKKACDIQGRDRFPIDVKSIAQDYSRNVFPEEPITLVKGRSLSQNFEGALFPSPHVPGEWGIFYNSAIRSEGRINFTLGHELGHYLMHRNRVDESILCTRQNMWGWNSAYGVMEAEANTFASYLLMPLDDFRFQTSHFKRPTLSHFEVLRDRYNVSITAAVLKWLDITPRRAMIVVSRDGFIDWSWCSKPLLKSGVYFKPRQQTTPIPDASLAARGSECGLFEIEHAAGIWDEYEPVLESAIFSEYHDMVISLLVFPPEVCRDRFNEFDEGS